ncbi:MAG: hypothetical protein R3C32_00755 [Chloroflexota bacterium]
MVAWADLRDDETDGLAVGDWVAFDWAPAAASIWAGDPAGTEV